MLRLDQRGRVDARNIHGDLTVRDNNGNVDLANIAGAADITNSFGSVNFTDVRGRVSVTTNNGRVKGTGLPGPSVTVRDSFGTIELDTVAGSVDAETSNGKIYLRDARGAVTLKTSFGAIEASNIPKGIRAVTGNGGITLTDIGGETYAKTSFGAVSIDRVAGNLQRRDGELRIAQRRRHLAAIEVEVAYLRALNRQRAVDVVIGERRCLRREQIANGCGDAAGAGQRRPQPRIARQPRIAIAVGRRSAGCRNRLGAVGRRRKRNFPRDPSATGSGLERWSQYDPAGRDASITEELGEGVGRSAIDESVARFLTLNA